MQALLDSVKSLSADERKALAALLKKQGVNLYGVTPIGLRDTGDQPGLSYAQRRQWVLWQLEPDSAAYNLPVALRLTGPLHVEALGRSFSALIARHETLRTRFAEVDGLPVQVIESAEPLRLVVESLPDVDPASVQAWVAAEAAQPFDLQHGPLLRVRLLRVAHDQHVLTLTLHHIVSDGWSTPILVRELIALYEGFCQGREVSLPALPIQYADYAQWQRQWMDAGERERQLAYWQAQLGDEQPVLELPMDRLRPARSSFRGARLPVPLSPALSQALQGLARERGVTLFMLLLASFQTLLHRYSGQRDIRVGVPVANRNRVETEGLIGFFVNTQVLRAQFDSGQRFEQILMQVRQAALEAQAHQDLPFEELVEALQPERSVSHSPLFQVMYNHQSASKTGAQQLSGLQIERIEGQAQVAKFDLSLDSYESDGQVSAALLYATDLFDAATIERLAAHWLTLLEAICRDPSQAVATLPLMAAQEREALLQAWDQSGAPVEMPAVHRLFEAQVQRTPQAVAVIAGDCRLSYAQLNAQANRLAHWLIGQGVGPEVRVAIAMSRSEQSLVAFLAVLKAGGAYVPLDVAYPAERLLHMMNDSRAALVLSEDRWLARLPLPQGTPGVAVDRLEALALCSDTNPTMDVAPGNLAYVIYTSGSTGLPKGVAVEHGPLAMHIQATGERYETSPADCELHFMSFAFDGAHEGWMHPLINGARVLVRDDRIWLPDETCAQMHRHGVTIGVFPPIYLQQLAEHVQREGAGAEPPVRVYCFGGEAVSQASYELAHRVLRPRWIFNGYGPTETVVTPLIWKAGASDRCGAAYAPIGELVGQRSGYVLNAELELQPQGLAGELYLGGQGVARGYLDRAGLTAERFVPDLYGAPGARLYRSGDQTRYRRDGLMEYLSRVDHQVKVRGFRIELGEVEARLLAHAQVREAVVLAQDGPAGKQLVGYVVVSDGLQAAELRQQLKTQLPDYMVPSHVLVIPALPLTPNGKLDRKALPLPDASALQAGYVAPRSDIEVQLAAIWSDVLKLARVGLDDNFFELGGDSIMSIQVVSRARHQGLHITPKQLFEHQTVAELARVARRGATVAIEQGAVRGDAPLTPIQTWFMATDIPQRGHWNQAVMLAPRARLQADLLARALRMIVDHHDALRGRLQQGQVNYDGDAHNPLWQREAMDDTALAAVADEAQRSLDLQHGTLLRAVLIELPDGEQRLLLVVHHWVIDGVSWRIVLEDLQAVYTALEDGQPARLPAKTDSFKTWAQRLQSLASEPSFIQSLGYWEGQLSKASDALPCDRPQGLQTQAHARSVRTRLDRDWTRRLLQEAPQAYRTQINDLLLTALSRVLCRWAEQPATLIRLEGHGRESLFDDVDITRTVGWFTSVYPVCLCPDIGMGESIKAIKEQLRAVPEKGIGYGLLRYLGPEPVRARLASLPQGQVVFNYLGQFDQSFDAQHGVFIPAGESSGAGQSGDTPLPARLAINGQVFAGELELNWTFSAELYDEAQIQRLADELGRELQALVAHCEAADSGGLTPSDVPLSGLDQAQLDRLPVPARDVADLYPLSPMQQGMLFHSLSEQDGGAYINQLRLDISGLDVERFRHAWQATLDAHDVLRASFLSDQAASLQLIRKRVKLPFSECDWQGHAQLPEALDTFATVDRQRGFDLQEEPLLRLTAIKTGPDNHHLIYTNHHILMDGWSNSRLLGEVLQRYAGVSVAAPSGRFRDYIQWLGRQDASADEAFWHEQLRGFDEPTRLAQAIKRPEGGEGKGQGEWQQSFDADATQRLVAFSRQHRVTVNTVVQAAWLLLLHRYSGQASVSFGATVAGRPAALPGIEEQLGLFINTLPVIAKVPAEQSAGQWLEQLQAQNLRLREHEHTPLYAVQRWAGRSGESLFDTLLVFENYPVAEALQQASPAGLKFGPVFSREQTNYPLTLAVGLGQQLKVHYSFDRASYALETVQQVAEHWRQLLESICANADAPLGELQMLTAPQLHLVQRWSGAQPIAAAPSSVLAGIAVQVRDQPDAVALICEGQQLSYRQLDERAEALVPTLVRHGAGPEVPVGLAVDRGLGLIIGVLAILKAGSAYVPLDPAYPAERLSYMMGDSGMQLLITQRHWLAHLALPPSVQGLCLDVDEHWQRALGDRAPAPVTGGNLAYIMYTSGSTGRPKGVGISHHALAEHAQMSQGFFNLTHDDRMLQFATFSFDGFVEQLYPALMCGAAVVIRGNELWDSATFYAELLANDISVVDITTAYWFMLAKDFAEHGHRDYGRLKQLHAGGEAMPPEGLVAWRQAGLAQVRLLNTYGPTEATVTVSAHDCGPYVDQTVALPAVLPIGRPLPGRSLYLLDVDAQCAPVAAAAELCIGGPLLARGYHGRPGLTAERFLPDPFGAPGARLYRSGDLARYRQSGVIDYVGRLDHQVKIRGMRIELGEIEACLLAQPSVREALVIDVAGPAGRQLAAYVVAQSAECAGPLLGTTLKAHLSVELPDYMVPTLWTVLAQLPLSPNGKLDRSALPAPQSRVQESHFSAPRTLLEIKLAHIWAQVLKVDQVGLEDNFFELGGDSITCMQVVARARDLAYLGLDLKVRDMLSKPSIGQLLGQDAPASALLPLNRKVEGRAPLFCVHGGFGTVFDYQPLARALDGLCPVVGIQSRMLVDEQWADTSLEQMALDYVERVRAHQPEGPYRLLGWSLGGTLVSLMTAQLERQGQQVAFLGLVDSFVETPTTAAGDPGWLSDLRGFWGLIAPFWTLPPLQQSGDDQMTREQVRQVFASILTSMDAEGAARADGYLALSADELASIFHAARKLRRLAERFEGCQPVVAQPTDWWTPGREGKARQLAAQLGCALAHATAIDCTHVEIPRHPLLLSTLVARLG